MISGLFGNDPESESEPNVEPEPVVEPEPIVEPEPEPVSLFADLGEELVLKEDYFSGLIDEPHLKKTKSLKKIDLGGHVLDLCGLSLTVVADEFTIQNGVLTNGSLTVRAGDGDITVTDVRFSKAGFHAEAANISATDAIFESMLTIRAETFVFAGESSEMQSYASVTADNVAVDGAACPLSANCRPSLLTLMGNVDVSVCSAIPLIRAVGTCDGSLTLRRGADVKLLAGTESAELSVSIQPGASLLAVAAGMDCHFYSERKTSYMPDAAVERLVDALDDEVWETVPDIKNVTVGEAGDRIAGLVGEERGRDLLPFYLRWAYDAYSYDTLENALEELGMPENLTLTGLLNDYYAYFVLAGLAGDGAEAFLDEYGETILAVIESVDWETVGTDAERLIGSLILRLNEETDWIITEEDDLGTLYRFDEVAFVRTVRDESDRSMASLIFEIAGIPTDDAEKVISDLMPLLKRFPNTRLSGISLLINMMVSVIGLDFDQAQALRTGIYDAMDAVLSAVFGYEISFRELCRESGDKTLYEVLAEREGVDIAELSAKYNDAIDRLESLMTDPLSELRIGSSDFFGILDRIIEKGEKTDVTFRTDENGQLYMLQTESKLTEEIDGSFSYIHLPDSPLSLRLSALTPLGEVFFASSVTEREITLSFFAFGSLYEKTYQIPDLLIPDRTQAE